MNLTWKSLLWKEWREQRWRLVALTMLLALPAILFFFLVTSKAVTPFAIGDYLSILTAFSSCYIILAGCFLGMHVAGGEKAQRTMHFMQALPTPTWQAGLVKLIVSLFVAILPLLLLYGVVSAIFPVFITEETLSEALEWMGVRFRHVQSLFEWALYSITIGVLGVSSLLLWMSAGGVNRSDEVRAGAIGFLVSVSAWMIFALIMPWVREFSDLPVDRMQYFISALPGGPAIAISNLWLMYPNLSRLLLVVIVLISHGPVLAWYLKRFGRVAVPPKRAGTFEFDLFRWRTKNTATMGSQLQAIAWKQLRETGPLAALTVAVVLLIVPVVYYFTKENNAQMELGLMIGAVSLSAGFFVIQVAGIGVFLEDFAPGVNNFWRSRPINIHWWFVIKFVTGLAVLCVAFGALSLIALSLMEIELANTSKREITASFYFIYVLVLLYSLAMASYCILRQPIYAAVLTVGIFLVGMMSIDWLFPNADYFWGGTVTMFSCLAIPLTIAWLAVKHDWGWKAGR